MPDIVYLMSISASTARRYIDELISLESGMERIRNGITVAFSYLETEAFFKQKLKIHTEAKQRIAHKAVELILDNHSLLIDSGSTCYFFAKLLYQKKLRVITTDLKVCMALGQKENICSLYSLGGEIRTGFYSIGGMVAVDNLRNFNVQTAVMSADAIDIEYGITNTEMFEVPIKKEIRKRASEIILLADSSKFSKRLMYSVMPLEQVDVLITDSNISEEILLMLNNKKIKVHVV